jgi:hypothetical protein
VRSNASTSPSFGSRAEPRASTYAAAAAALVLLHGGCGSQSTAVETTAASTLYVRADTNATTVWTPREQISTRIADTAGLEAALTIDAWTSASIDIVTAATRNLTTGEQHYVSEVRKEVTAGGYYEFGNATIAGGYRYSTENDYWSHGGVGNLTLDLAEKNTTLVFTALGSKDEVGRAGDRYWRAPQSSIGGRVALTQVLDTKSLLQVSWETVRISGYQASPYRYVAIGDNGTCASLAPFCLPEVVPDERWRSAAVVRARRALGNKVSIGLEYRFYFDDWGLYSHTITPDLQWLVSDHGTLGLSYRYYTQSEADFYRPRYLSGPALGYLTRDRELSALYSNRLGLTFTHEFHIQLHTTLMLGARLGLTRFRYLAFVGLSQVDALEATGLLSLGFR